MTATLGALRVVELGCGLPASYASKLLALLGADVVKVEPLVGDPERGRGPNPDDVVNRERGGGLFRYLNADKRSVLLDPTSADDVTTLRALISATDVLVESLGAGGLEALGMAPASFAIANPHLAVVRISPFGQRGPDARLPATGLTVMARGGWVWDHGVPGAPPVQTGGRLHEYATGAYAAAVALTAVRAGRAGHEPAIADLSAFEVVLSTLPCPISDRHVPAPTGWIAGFGIDLPVPGIVRCADGFVGINARTERDFQDVCAMLDAPEFASRRAEVARDADARADFLRRVQCWLDARTVDEIVGLGQAFRIPVAPVANGEMLLRCPQLLARDFFVTEPDGDLVVPGPPWRLGETPAAVRRAAPTLRQAAETAASFHAPRLPESPAVMRTDPSAPFSGLCVLELSADRTASILGMYLGAFGADVVKIESVPDPDAPGCSGATAATGGDAQERDGAWRATNLDKRDVTLDVRHDDGQRLLRLLVARADVVIESGSPEPLAQAGLEYEALRALRRDVVVVRMPPYGLAGPWRDYAGAACEVEQASGLAHVTGWPDQPGTPLGTMEPVTAMHAVVALQAALDHRDRTGVGQLIEVAQLEVACCLTADQPLEQRMNGRDVTRTGNREPRIAPQGVYRGEDGDWVAMSVRHDVDWRNLLDALDRPLWVTDEFATVAGRLVHHDALDDLLAEWFAARTAHDAAMRLRASGVPSALLACAPRLREDAQLRAREYVVALADETVGERYYVGWPARFSFARAAHRVGPPSLGQHNREVLSALGVSDAELARLEVDGVIGDRWSTSTRFPRAG